MNTIVITSAFLPGNLENYCKKEDLKVIRLNNDVKSIFPKWILVAKLLLDALKCFKYLKTLRQSDVIITVFFVSIPILLLRKLGLLGSNKKIVWCGFFVHDRKYFRLFKWLFRFFFSRNDRLIVYSKYEQELYAKEFGLQASHLFYVPLVYSPGKSIYTNYTNKVDWSALPNKYFFSGGYSHRDYESLIAAFQKIDSNLIICSSTLNNELKGLKLPLNIKILNDVLKDDFGDLIEKSQACIILIKNDSGAAGQLFTLEAMYKQKVVISSSTSVLMEMIDNRINGFVVKDAISEIPGIVKQLEDDRMNKDIIGANAKKTVVEEYGVSRHNTLMDKALQY